MGRRKQNRPHRSVGILQAGNDDASSPAEGSQSHPLENGSQVSDSEKPFYVYVDRSNWVSNDHLDVSELVLSNVDLIPGFSGMVVDHEFYEDSKYCFRLRVSKMSDESVIQRVKLGHWPLLSSSDVAWELIEMSAVEGREEPLVILSGFFDGADNAITGLVHLTSLRFLTLRPVFGVHIAEGMVSLRVRVELLKSVFDVCESLLDSSRQPWKKSMMNLMAWLRPEVMNSEVRYGITRPTQMESNSLTEMEDDGDDSSTQKCGRFDVSGFYEAIKPSKDEPMLEEDIPGLLPMLRPYQRRAAYWMVQQEKEKVSAEKDQSHLYSPFCLPVDLLDTCSKIFYNPFSGNFSMHQEFLSTHVSGGILADEMGLGKTVELLACIFSHQKSASESCMLVDTGQQDSEYPKGVLRRLKRERVECICGSVSDSYNYKGLWVQCDVCDAWQHADCVGYSPRGKKKRSTISLQKHRKKTTVTLVERDGDHICLMCSELIQATDSPIPSGATLIVCPAPILPQWQIEIERHTVPGSLKTCVYEGVRDASFSHASSIDVNELVNADIVLTTYDTLKEDLSHDFDRHEGDRHSLRFQKRYHVLPTFLTRIYWWRICMDEAQMVESNAAAATEMALRISAKYRWCITGTPIQRKLDDLYGLMKFLKASPLDVSRWWVDVIRDPYERNEACAIEFTHKFFKKFMWRSMKIHVADELQIPPQEECVSWLTFSAIEDHFYRRQHETCMDHALEVVKRLKEEILKRKVPGSISSDGATDPFITHTEAAKLLNSLLKLRQACCHPQVGSYGLRSIQQSPMTMEEILMVLVGKTKTEGEEALRKLVVALNALAGLAMIQQNYTQAVSLYKEALDLTNEHSEDFRVDPLLSIHVHYNLYEILPFVHCGSPRLLSSIQQLPGSSEMNSEMQNNEKSDKHDAKGHSFSGDDSVATADHESLAKPVENGSKSGEHNFEWDSSAFDAGTLKAVCENLKQKYLSVFTSKLSVAQQEFRKSCMQVCNALSKQKDRYSVWWLDALQQAEVDKDLTTELISKVEEAVLGTLNNSRSSRIPQRFRSVTALKYHLQTSLDQLEESRKTLLDRLLEIDGTMEKPKEEDIERVRYCRLCQPLGDGPVCVHCDLEDLFQDYEARLFRFNKKHGEIISAEEALDMQKQSSALNRFYWKLLRPNKSLFSSADVNEESKKRDLGERVAISKLPSEVEVVLGVIRNCCKVQLGEEGESAARKHLHILQSMRKEYRHSRSLAAAQAHLLRTHDEIKMATSRLRLRENDDDKSLDVLGLEELEPASVQHSGEKFMALASLSQIKGKLRYLKGLVKSKQKPLVQSSNGSSLAYEDVSTSGSEEKAEALRENDMEACPICQEKLNNQKMVFQCGHVTCCKCFVAITERRFQDHRFQHKWVMCPVCRQPTDYRNIAYADDGHCTSVASLTAEDQEMYEASLVVQGSYGTKIEAVTRRLMWIKSSDPTGKVLVFSSWKDVLDVLEHAFKANNISYIRMKGGRKSHAAISKFRGQKSSPKTVVEMDGKAEEPKYFQVLLLLIQHGANGLNLLEAQHVILVEPLLNPAVEAQAISRVHRIGQEKRTVVHRFIVKGTVEESIYKLNQGRNTSSFISGNTKNQDQPALTLKDIESLFSTADPLPVEEEPCAEETRPESLRHLPPSAAAAIAAERRQRENAAATSTQSS